MRLFLLLSVAWTAIACGANTTGDDDPNNGGKTNWLRSCEQDSECGSLRCVAQLCTRQCAKASDCDDLDSEAACGQLIAGEAALCTIACESHDDCGGEQFCYKERCDAPGECRKSEGTGCDQVYDPVCGCDGETHGNACTAASAAIGVDYAGECTDDCEGDDCLESGPDASDPDGPDPDSADGVDAGTPSTGGCENNDDCGDGAYCLLESCGELGECQKADTNQGCSNILYPVCGCDGTTYGNECGARLSGAGVAHEGECESTDAGTPEATGCTDNDGCANTEYCHVDACGAAGECRDALPCDAILSPVCGCDQQTYGNECEARSSGVGISAQGECSTEATTCADGELCECLSPDDCGPGNYCFRQGCDAPGECRAGEEPVCPPEFDPVCSCDGATVDNCTAQNSGQGVAYPGECIDDASYGAHWRSTRLLFGFCGGECAFRLTRNLEAPTQITFDACDYQETSCERQVVLQLNDEGLALLKQAHREFRGSTLEAQYGCPGCADGGATLVVLESESGVTEHAYEYSNPPPVFASLDALHARHSHRDARLQRGRVLLDCR